MLKRCIISLWVMCLLVPVSLRAGEGGLVINRFQISGATGSSDEFVELKNTGLQEVNLANWQLGKISSSGTKGNLITLFPEFSLAAGQTVVIGHPNYMGTADLRYSSASYYLSNDSAIALYGPKQADNTRMLIDSVGYGKSPVFETKATPAPKEAEIFGRKNGGQDTDNNEDDFYLAYSPPKSEAPSDDDEGTPQTGANATEATPGAKIIVSEFMINPEGSDADGEWIEIYNAGSEANITGYVVADLVGSPKKYTFPKGTMIKSKQYLAFYSGQTPISLNNDGDAVEVRSPNGAVISTSSNSGKGPEGASFALNGTKWAWTAKPTPGRANIIETPSEGTTNKEGKNKEVLGLVDESQLPTEAEVSKSQTAKKNDQLMGYGLIVLAILGGISYTLSINKEKLRDFYYNKIRKRDHLSGSELRQKLKRR